MFFVLSKILSFLLSPVTWIAGFALAGMLVKQSPRRFRFFLVSGVMVLFFTNPFMRNAAFRIWETPSVRIGDLSGTYDAGILLGGAMRYFNAETGRIVYGNSVDRVIHAAALYRRGKIRTIVVTGGSGWILQPGMKEGTLMKDVLMDMGIPAGDILVENESRNTHQNAALTAPLLRRRFPKGRFLLITSAYHMRRTMGCFAREGIRADAFAVDQYAGRTVFSPDRLIVPDAASLVAWDYLIHEWAGFVAYKFAGYL